MAIDGKMLGVVGMKHVNAAIEEMFSAPKIVAMRCVIYVLACADIYQNIDPIIFIIIFLNHFIAKFMSFDCGFL